MSDEHEEHEHNGFAFQFGPTAEQVEQARMAGESNGHETREFFDSLNVEQLKKLSALFNHTANTEGNAAIYYIGLISGFLDLKYKLCVACGKDHDKMLADMSGQQDVLTEAVPLAVDHDPGFPVKDSAEYLKLMAAYNTEQDDDGSDRVMCKGCGLWYINLQDRALRPKDGCHGCQQKSAWG